VSPRASTPTGTPRPPGQAPKPPGTRFAAYKAAFPELAAEFVRRMKGELPKHFAQVAVDTVVAAHTKAETVASRKASQMALEPSPRRCPSCWAAAPT
jgi:transketolase